MPRSMDEDKDELIAALVTRSLEARHGDTPVPTVEERCHEHPELVDDLRAALDVAERLPALQGAAGFSRSAHLSQWGDRDFGRCD